MSVAETRACMKAKRPTVLVVQDEADFVPSVLEPFQGTLVGLRASSLEDARRQLVQSQREIAGAVVAQELSDGTGFELLPDLRARAPKLPVLLLASVFDVHSINTAHLEGVALVARQNCGPNLRHFAMQIQTARACAASPLRAAMEQIAQHNQLSEREQQLLTVAVHGIPRARLALKLGLSENTVKSQIRSLLDKTNQPNLSEVVWQVHRSSEQL